MTRRAPTLADIPRTVPPGRWAGGAVADGIHCLLAPNASPMTLEGTNTYVLTAPDARTAVVVDPGPADTRHRDALLRHLERCGVGVAFVLLTHHHHDHAEGAADVAHAVGGVPIRAGAEGSRPPALEDPTAGEPPAPRPGDLSALGCDHPLRHGETLDVAGLRLTALHTPGHTRDSYSFVLPDQRAVLTGDTVLGWGTTVVAHPDGTLDDYLASLDTLAAVTDDGTDWSVLPAHGAPLPDAATAIRAYRHHRRQRLDQVRAVVDRLPADLPTAAVLDAVWHQVYADTTDPAVRPAADRSVLAQLAYLRSA